jgi:starch phosphorylase
MEYGIDASLPLYAGGLGVLSGDHLKSASDLGVPLIGVGLLYRYGYFHQTVDPDGLQQHSYAESDFTRVPLRPVADGNDGRARWLSVHVPFPGRDLAVGVWVAKVGRVPLLLLTTDVPENHPADRTITNVLYVRSREVRLAQELVLGVGGVRAIRALGITPAVWHMNEGHSAFLQVERLREGVSGGESLEDAVARVRRDAVFTTHTPVPAGHEEFDPALAQRYLEPLAAATPPLAEGALGLGRANGAQPAPLNLTALGLRTAARANAVSRLNAEVCDRMWHHLRPDVPADQAVIRPITNGVHPTTWMGRSIRALFERHLGATWQRLLRSTEAWEAVGQIPDEELWAAHREQKQRLIRFVRARLREQLARHGGTPDDLRALDGWFDPDVLTIGFARRFATYKRVWLVFSDLDRARRLLTNPDRPVQLVFSGKAHPADRPGQELIRQTAIMGHQGALRGRVCFLEDYNLRVAGMLVQGTDVWLNTPRRPMEASGTSGQKAALNGVLNVSVLDGWWPEGFDGQNGWAIGDGASEHAEEEEQDRLDAEALYTVLEQQVVPTYYDRDAGGMPRAWATMMKRAIVTIAPRFSSGRMVRDYVDLAYLPAARDGTG